MVCAFIGGAITGIVAVIITAVIACGLDNDNNERK